MPRTKVRLIKWKNRDEWVMSKLCPFHEAKVRESSKDVTILSSGSQSHCEHCIAALRDTKVVPRG